MNESEPPVPVIPQLSGLAAGEDVVDLREKVARAWREFARVLADLLPGLPVGAHLDVTVAAGALETVTAGYSITVTVVSNRRLAAYAVGNASLAEDYRLDRAAIADMVTHGWSPPGIEPGSGERFGLTVTVDDASLLASTLVLTLRDVYGAPHPAFLMYVVRDASGQSLDLPQLGGARAATGSSNRTTPPTLSADGAEESAAQHTLQERVRTVIAEMLQTTPAQLVADADGDIGIRAGTEMVFVRVRDNPPLVDVFSPILTDVTPTQMLYRRLSELTSRMPVGRLYCVDDTVWASVPVFGRNFQRSHLILAVQVMIGLAGDLAGGLHSEFGGRRFFAEGGDLYDRGTSHSAVGMYLAEANRIEPIVFGKHSSAAAQPVPPVAESIAVDAYLDTNDNALAQRVLDALDEVSLLLGYEGPVEEQRFNGSIWRRAKAIRKSGMSSEDLRRRLVKLERALELAHLDSRQAEVDAKTAEAVTGLIASLSDIPQACLRVGSILIVKYHDRGTPVLLTRNLSQLEIRALERFPEVQTKPQRVLDALATAIASLPPMDRYEAM